jgi:hypothetical protein
MKIFPLWIAFVLGIALLGLATTKAFADPLVWQTPYGTIGLPFSATEALLGYGAISREAIAGASLPVYADPKNIIALEVGAVTAWPTNGAAVEPYLAIGHNIAQEIPILAQFKSLHLNAFGRYVSETGKADVGVSVSYAFAQ